MWGLVEMANKTLTPKRLREIAKRDALGLCIQCTGDQKQQRLGVCNRHWRQLAKKWAACETELERQKVIAGLEAKGLCISSRRGRNLQREREMGEAVR